MRRVCAVSHLALRGSLPGACQRLSLAAACAASGVSAAPAQPQSKHITAAERAVESGWDGDAIARSAGAAARRRWTSAFFLHSSSLPGVLFNDNVYLTL